MALTAAALAGALVLTVLVPMIHQPVALIGVFVGALTAAELTLRIVDALNRTRHERSSRRGVQSPNTQ